MRLVPTLHPVTRVAWSVSDIDFGQGGPPVPEGRVPHMLVVEPDPQLPAVGSGAGDRPGDYWPVRSSRASVKARVRG